MTDEILFRENQKFNQWWIWILIIGVNGLIGYAIIQRVMLGKPFGDHLASNFGLFMVLGLPLLIALLFYCLKLETVITRDGIYVKFFPFYLKFKHYSWEEIQNLYVRKYNPIMEFGGRGLRGFRRNRALNVSGNMGLQLELKEGKRLLIGTRKAEELDDVIKHLTKIIQDQAHR